MATKLYQEIANLVQARQWGLKNGNTVAVEMAEKRLQEIEQNLLPSGGGLDNGTSIDLDKSTGRKIVLHCSFHHMDEHGFYVGWTEHTITVVADLITDFDLKISGRNKNEIKEYLAEIFDFALRAPVDTK